MSSRLLHLQISVSKVGLNYRDRLEVTPVILGVGVSERGDQVCRSQGVFHWCFPLGDGILFVFLPLLLLLLWWFLLPSLHHRWTLIRLRGRLFSLEGKDTARKHWEIAHSNLFLCSLIFETPPRLLQPCSHACLLLTVLYIQWIGQCVSWALRKVEVWGCRGEQLIQVLGFKAYSLSVGMWGGICFLPVLSW